MNDLNLKGLGRRRESEEANASELLLASEQGEALAHALEHMTGEVAQDGCEVEADDYRVGYAVEEAEGLYLKRDGRLEWTEPGEENVHIEISVRDIDDGRFIPGLTVRVTLLDESGASLGTHHHPLLWHPWLYHYGRNWKVPKDGRYKMRVAIDSPDFGRHDKVNGARYQRAVEVVFDDVQIKTGRKLS